MDRHWFVTWTTYGSWLPGDPRGFRTFRGREYVPPPRRYAEDERVYNPADYAGRYQGAKQEVPVPVMLNATQQQIVQQAVVGELRLLPIQPLILAIGTCHIHLIAQFGGLLIRPTVGRLKAAATRALPNPGTRKRVWTKECHMCSLDSEEALRNRVSYVRQHAEQGALIYEWHS